MQSNLKKLFIMLPVMVTLIGTITAIMTFANLSVSQDFMPTWISNFVYAFLVLLPMGGIIFTVLNKLINQYFSAWSSLKKNILQGALMALIMESIMAVISILTTHNYTSIHNLSTLFFNSLLYALPVGLIFSLFMTLVLKPKLETYLS
ncbi:hypothetical protein [Pseudocolwellia agarivorans]|uniref:hypothetical protein n=1 Tax=Pseudocolwellia agarivorans TaxID=1911682 RepID=UPI003F882640